MKILKFSANLVPRILSGEKTATWRMFDDKNLQEGDEMLLMNKETREVFAKAHITSVKEKRLEDITEKDFDGHEPFESQKKMLETYRGYYGDAVTWGTLVKLIDFEILK
jgi:hypothetical protein